MDACITTLTFNIQLLVFLSLVFIASCCNVTEREALLDVKRGLEDPSGRLSAWTGHDCCKWPGIACDAGTGFVREINLRNPDESTFPNSDYSIGGKISPSLLHLEHLHHLDLSMNKFDGEPIPSFLGSLNKLVYLNLSCSGFNGTVPHQLGNLSVLTHLDISCFYDWDLLIDDSSWLYRLSSLQVLNLGNIAFIRSDNLFLSLNLIHSVREIHLSFCNITSIPTTIPHMNFSHLTLLDLSGNHIHSMPLWLFNITTLEYLDLNYNLMSGTIPDMFREGMVLRFLSLSDNFNSGSIPPSMGKLCYIQVLDLTYSNITGNIEELQGIFSGCIKKSLEELRLGYNRLYGSLPQWLWELRKLKVLQLYKNQLMGVIPESIARLSTLEELRLSYNNLSGTIPTIINQMSNITTLGLGNNNLIGMVSQSHLSQLYKLKYLDLSNNSLHFNISSNWLPPFRLQYVRLRSCLLGPKFPTWIRLADKVLILDISSAGISDVIPEGYWRNITQVEFLNMSNNSLQGKLPTNWKNINFTYIDLHKNIIEGPLPPFNSMLEAMLLSDNKFSGSIDPTICEIAKNLFLLILSNNNLSGSIPSCWNSSSQLQVLDLSHNRLTGGIPEEIGSLFSLQKLHLNGNELSGELPPSLKGCTRLQVLDLGDNHLGGVIPSTIVESLSSLTVLRLRSNMFSGEIPLQLMQLPFLHVIDVAHNKLTGKIPNKFSNSSSFKISNSIIENYMYTPLQNMLMYDESIAIISNSIIEDYMSTADMLITIISKGIQMYLSTMLQLTSVVSIDLSFNDLCGPIPIEFGQLIRMQTLNLSNNHLDGRIPETVAQLKSLETLDLSVNDLSGEIPHSMIYMTFLSSLNVSYNNLSGQIPTENQFATFTDPSIYIGNPHLYGFPLEKKCHSDGEAVVEIDTIDHSKKLWLYFSMVLGFIFGFWIFYGMLKVNKNWGDTYFLFLDHIIENVCSRFSEKL